MDLQADIKWIKSELNQVTDQNLIEAFKQLLTYRKNKVDESNLDNALDRAIKDAEEGRVKSHDEIRKKYTKWL
jgi:predicted transcriptional regulator